MINIGSHMEVLWDDCLVDTKQTTAEKLLHHPVRRERVMTFDAPWEGDACGDGIILEEDGFYRLYYYAASMFNEDMSDISTKSVRICYAESPDGIHWLRPSLGLAKFQDSFDNNIIIDDLVISNMSCFYVFKDLNPNCLADEKYKVVCSFCHSDEAGKASNELVCMLSADGIHFRYGWTLTSEGAFSALNTALYNQRTGKYMLFIRDFHNSADLSTTITQQPFPEYVRDIRWLESDDFKTWTQPKHLDFQGRDDYELYENGISSYMRADQMLIGFPLRYVERKLWTKNYDRLCGAQHRRMRFNILKACGLVVTDCGFMCSRDGKIWTRFDDAFKRPEREHQWGWIQGDCTAVIGMIETPTEFKDEDNDLSMYFWGGRMSQHPMWLSRYTIRLDGFVSRHAGYEPRELVTLPFVFTGKELEINFETSAKGYLFVEITDKNGRPLEGYRSCELFGDSSRRIVDFDKPVEKLVGRPVRLKITMSDADLYAFRFR